MRIKPPKPPAASEHDIMTMIANYLTMTGFFTWRNNSGMIAVGEGKSRRMIRLGTAGLPDLFAIKNGHLLGIEVKRPKKKPTELQNIMHQVLRDHGCYVIVATSIEDVQQGIKDSLSEIL